MFAPSGLKFQVTRPAEAEEAASATPKHRTKNVRKEVFIVMTLGRRILDGLLYLPIIADYLANLIFRQRGASVKTFLRNQAGREGDNQRMHEVSHILCRTPRGMRQSRNSTAIHWQISVHPLTKLQRLTKTAGGRLSDADPIFVWPRDVA